VAILPNFAEMTSMYLLGYGPNANVAVKLQREFKGISQPMAVAGFGGN
jgi:hypothetical protein